MPPLVFGNDFAQTHIDSKLYAEHTAKIVPSLKHYFPLGDPNKFISSGFALKINSLKMIASASTPVSVEASEFKDINLMIPLFGENDTFLDGKSYHWSQNQYAVLMPNVNRGGTSTLRSILTFDLNPGKLFETARIMLGDEYIKIEDLKLHEPRLIPLSYGGFSFDSAIRKLCLYTDQYINHNSLLESIGIDEQFYRLIVMMLMPERFFNDDQIQSHTSIIDSYHAIKLLIDYAHSTSHVFHTLSDLEEFTGLSSRMIQMGFKKHLNITPTMWLRINKMNLARKMIIENRGYLTITAIALECGFTNFSLFAKYYREQFGELPSETLQKSKLF